MNLAIAIVFLFSIGCSKAVPRITALFSNQIQAASSNSGRFITVTAANASFFLEGSCTQDTRSILIRMGKKAEQDASQFPKEILTVTNDCSKTSSFQVKFPNAKKAFEYGNVYFSYNNELNISLTVKYAVAKSAPADFVVRYKNPASYGNPETISKLAIHNQSGYSNSAHKINPDYSLVAYLPATETLRGFIEMSLDNGLSWILLDQLTASKPLIIKGRGGLSVAPIFQLVDEPGGILLEDRFVTEIDRTPPIAPTLSQRECGEDQACTMNFMEFNNDRIRLTKNFTDAGHQLICTMNTCIYSPAKNYPYAQAQGIDTFSYVAYDAAGNQSGIATANIKVLQDNDAPELGSFSCPTSTEEIVIRGGNTSGNNYSCKLAPFASDVDTDMMSLSLNVESNCSWLTKDGLTLTGSPIYDDVNLNFPCSVKVRLSDGTDLSSQQEFSITVKPAPLTMSVSYPSLNNVFEFDEDHPINSAAEITDSQIQSNKEGAMGTSYRILDSSSCLNQAQYLAIDATTGAVNFSPKPNYFGECYLKIQVSDYHHQTAEQSILIRVKNTPDTLQITNACPSTVTQNSSVSCSIMATDPDGYAVTATPVAQGCNPGSFSCSAGQCDFVSGSLGVGSSCQISVDFQAATLSGASKSANLSHAFSVESNLLSITFNRNGNPLSLMNPLVIDESSDFLLKNGANSISLSVSSGGSLKLDNSLCGDLLESVSTGISLPSGGTTLAAKNYVTGECTAKLTASKSGATDVHHYFKIRVQAVNNPPDLLDKDDIPLTDSSVSDNNAYAIYSETERSHSIEFSPGDPLEWDRQSVSVSSKVTENGAISNLLSIDSSGSKLSEGHIKLKLSAAAVDSTKYLNLALTLTDSDVISGESKQSTFNFKIRLLAPISINITDNSFATGFNLSSYFHSSNISYVSEIPLNIQVNIAPGVTVGSSDTHRSAFDTGSSFPEGTVLKLINNGYIIGRGGKGGDGDTGYNYSYKNGRHGGPALKLSFPTYVINLGTIGGGGGGGGGGAISMAAFSLLSGNSGMSAQTSGEMLYAETYNQDTALITYLYSIGGGGGGGGAGYQYASGGSAAGLYFPSAGSASFFNSSFLPGAGGNGGELIYIDSYKGGKGGSGGGLGQNGSNGSAGVCVSGFTCSVGTGGAAGPAITGCEYFRTSIASGTTCGNFSSNVLGATLKSDGSDGSNSKY